MTDQSLYLSICIPTYNRSACLQKCLHSVAREIKCGGLEKEVTVLISDNASTDNTREVVDAFLLQHNTLQTHYTVNSENIGAVNNFIRLSELSPALYTYILGDDDELVEGSLLKVMNVMKANKDSLVHHYKCVQTDFIPAGMPEQKLGVFEAAEKYFYNIGNAGTFLFHTESGKEVIAKAKARIAASCWPQTEIMFSILMKAKQEKAFLVSGIELVNSESHNDNVVYNSWYILETFCFSLLRVAQHIKNDYGDERILHAAKKAIPACRQPVKFFFRFLLFVTYYDYKYELEKTHELIADNKKYLKGSNRFYPLAYGLLFSLPRFIKKMLTAFYFWMSAPTLKKVTFDKQYQQVKDYQQRKFTLYKQKGKLTEDTERYIY